MPSHLLLLLFSCVFLGLLGAKTPAFAIESGDVLADEILSPWQGDLDGIRKRGVLRVLVPPSQTFMFFDKDGLKGLAVEALREFEKQLNSGRSGQSTEQIAIAIIPTRRDRLLPDLIDGLGDLAVGNLTITDSRSKLVEFSDPVYTDVRELIITSTKLPEFSSFKSLNGLEIHVRASSSYFESLAASAKASDAVGMQAKIVEADESLEDEELVEMVNAGLLPATIMDSHKFAFWRQIFGDVKAQENIPLKTGAEIGWALRKNNPALLAATNAFVQRFKKGTLLGNILYRRYLRDTQWLVNLSSDEYRSRADELRSLFQTYGRRYDVDWRLIAAQSFQESRFDQTTRSPKGAVGLMQVRPSTARDRNIGISDISTPDGNVHAGVKYLRFVADRYFNDPAIDQLNKILFALAAYNAGPARITKARARASTPNMWFGDVEQEVARMVGMEPVRYVSNIYRYFLILSKMYGDIETGR